MFLLSAELHLLLGCIQSDPASGPAAQNISMAARMELVDALVITG